jgi:hypothetical protein
MIRRKRMPAADVTRREFVHRSARLFATASAASFFGYPAIALPSQTGAQDPAHARIQGRTISLENGVVAAEWDFSPAGLRIFQVRDRRSGRTIDGPKPAFSLRLADGSEVASSAMRLIGAPKIDELAAVPRAARFSDGLPGRVVSASFEDAQHGLHAAWRAVLREGSRYVRQEVQFSSLSGSLPIASVTMLDLDAAGAEVRGSVKGSPAVGGEWFFGFEHPLSESVVDGGRVLCRIERQLPLEQGRPASYSSVIGVASSGQLRRDFLSYVERERAHPYRTFLHYNSWYDLGFFTPYDERAAVDVIHAFGEELHAKRGVTLDSFLFDDGWDNHQSLWAFNAGFPNGFTPVTRAAGRYSAAPGVWLSPWGGYDGPKKERLEYGRQQGYEQNAGGFMLSGPRYFQRFRDVCLEMMRSYSVNQFKFDGTGNVSTVVPGSEFDSDFAAMIGLIADLRAVKPDLYVNLTTGTHPSPFWLRHADSIWRGGEDHSFAGVGSNRQQWITYRDAATYQHIVGRGPLYPLNSLMLHGLIYARHAEKLNGDPAGDFSAEVRSYFGSGTQLQEMYITPALLSEADWNVLAESSRWSRANADVLVDTHWIGGDPARLEPYGWASWSRRAAIVTLRNPDKSPHTFELDPQSAFELPSGAPDAFTARIRSGSEARGNGIALRAGRPHTVTLQPFEVLTFEAAPR